jgi:hypothetical protein
MEAKKRCDKKCGERRWRRYYKKNRQKLINYQKMHRAKKKLLKANI